MVSVLEFSFGHNRVLQVQKWGDRSGYYNLRTSMDQDIEIICIAILP